VGVHYPSDVLVGALIGTVGGQLVWKASQNLPKKKA
jgi:membrane-associated phospholipid phosphatase